MIKKILILSLAVFCLTLLPQIVLAQNPVDVWVFGTATCPYCKQVRSHLTEKIKENPQINYEYFELTGIGNQDNRDRLDTLKKIYSATDYTAVPATFIGETLVRGARLEEIDSAIKYCQENECESPREKLANVGDIVDLDSQTQPVGQTEAMVGWIILAIFVLVVVIFGVKIIKERKSL